MLSQINNSVMAPCAQVKTVHEEIWQRNEQEDMKKAIDCLYEFKEKLSKLHPTAQQAIDNLLQRPRY